MLADDQVLQCAIATNSGHLITVAIGAVTSILLSNCHRLADFRIVAFEKEEARQGE